MSGVETSFHVLDMWPLVASPNHCSCILKGHFLVKDTPKEEEGPKDMNCGWAFANLEQSSKHVQACNDQGTIMSVLVGPLTGAC